MSLNWLQLFRAAMACAIIEIASGFEPSSETTAPRRLKLDCYSTQLPLFYLDLSLDTTDIICHQFGLFSTDFYPRPCAGFVENFK